MRKKTSNKVLYALLILIGVLVIGLAVTYAVQKTDQIVNSVDPTVEIAQEIIDKTIFDLPVINSNGANLIAENTKVTVNSMELGEKYEYVFDCTYETVDTKALLEANADKYINAAYDTYIKRKENGQVNSSVAIKQSIADVLAEDIAAVDKKSGNVTLYLYQTKPKEYTLYLSDELVNTVYGGLLDARKIISSIEEIEKNGEKIKISKLTTITDGVADFIKLDNYEKQKPNTNTSVEKLFSSFIYDFNRNFIEGGRYLYIVNGLFTTIKISALAALFGIALGFIIAVIRCINQKTGKLELTAAVCKTYISVMRGTPLMVQLLIIYFVILSPLKLDAFTTAVICFGLNSGAYVSEIVRGGIMSIDNGQTEAGRSLGFNYVQTMWYIIIPQAFKAVLPSLANEFITLLKETSIAFYIGVADLTLAGNRIRSQTYSNYMPLIAVAVVYLILVLGLSKLVEILERRLAKSDRR